MYSAHFQCEPAELAELARKLQQPGMISAPFTRVILLPLPQRADTYVLAHALPRNDVSFFFFFVQRSIFLLSRQKKSCSTPLACALAVEVLNYFGVFVTAQHTAVNKADDGDGYVTFASIYARSSWRWLQEAQCAMRILRNAQNIRRLK